MNLSMRELRAFLALVEEKNFTRAADRTNISQPAFSNIIRQLESSLGARLFERTTRNVTLTPEGRLFETSARQLIDDFDSMVGDFRDYARRRKGRVGIAALPSICAGWLPDILAEYRRMYSGVDLTLKDAHSHQCLNLLRSRQVDIVIGSKTDQDTDLSGEFFCSDKFHLICRKDHPLARLRAPTVNDLTKYAFVHLSHNTSVRHNLDVAFRPAQMQTVLEVEHLATLARLVEAGLGISVVPTLTLFHFQSPRLVVKPLALRGVRRTLQLVRRKNDPLSAAADAMYRLISSKKPNVMVQSAKS